MHVNQKGLIPRLAAPFQFVFCIRIVSHVVFPSSQATPKVECVIDPVQQTVQALLPFPPPPSSNLAYVCMVPA